MTHNYVEEYNAEVSETSILTDEEDKKALQAKAPSALPPRQPERSRMPTPYTFDATSFMKNMDASTSYTNSKAGNTPLGYKPLSNFTTGLNYSRGNAKNPMPAPLKRSGSYSQLHSDMSMYTQIGDDYKRTEDYNKFSKEFETEFGNDQREMDHIYSELVTRSKKLENLARELQEQDLDQLLYKNRLTREIESAGNDLKEAYNNILTLMQDRSKMKEQFCVFRMKIKKLKGFIKTFQEDIEA